jgi:hypothetical protein
VRFWGLGLELCKRNDKADFVLTLKLRAGKICDSGNIIITSDWHGNGSYFIQFSV